MVRTSTFGVVRLSGQDAKTFKQQIQYGRPKKAACAAAKRGEGMLKEFTKNGQVAIKLKKA